MKIAVVCGICVEHDAISAAAAAQAAMLAELPGVEEVVLISQHHTRSTSTRALTFEDSWKFLTSPEIADIDVMIFHWGIRYDLFNALPLLSDGRRIIVHFHNLTPADLVPDDERATIEQSIRQMQLPALVGAEMWAVSEFNRTALAEWGYEPARVAVVPIEVTRPVVSRQRDIAPDFVRLLTVGRLVAAKGVDVLVEAMGDVVPRLDGRVELTLVGNLELSDGRFVARLLQRIRERRLARYVRIRPGLDDDALLTQFQRADVVVCPSLHEGLCVPVIEAYAAGCRVVGTDAGNVPFVVQPPDPVVPAGDAGALADAIVAVATSVLDGTSRLPDGAPALVSRYSSQCVRAALEGAIGSPTSAQATDSAAAASTS